MNLVNYLHTSPWFLPIRMALSAIYGFLVWIRNKAYDLGFFKTYKIKTPVVSVGNLSSGGSGKTILVQSLIHHFLSVHKKPVVLSRGYGRSSSGLVVVADESGLVSTLSHSGDEPFLIADNYNGVPVVVSESRVDGARYIESNFAADVIILDDGFQHRRLHRDLDILIVDFQFSSNPRLLPWGYLREQLQSISRADLVIYSKNGLQKDPLNNLVINMNNYVQDHLKKRIELSTLKGDYGLFAGLGNTKYFFDQVEKFHAPAQVRISLPDHANYSKVQLAEIKANSCDYWITTQKDFIKLDPAFCEAFSIYFIGVETSLPTPVLSHLKQHFNHNPAVKK